VKTVSISTQGHRSDAKNRILPHRNFLVGVLKADGLQIGELSASGDRHDKTGGIALFALRLKPRGDALQPPRRKAETVRIADGLQSSASATPVWKGHRSTDKRYAGDNRLMTPKSPYRRRRLAPRCRLIASWGARQSVRAAMHDAWMIFTGEPFRRAQIGIPILRNQRDKDERR
jgi:hypothetical protein